ncbi:MAG: FxsA family protein [Candidatus Portiera sp.]|nr:FxsA family protein [Portiera sp.]
MGTALLIFILAPLIEIYVLIQVGGEIGALSTILLILTTAALGVFIIQYQGIRVLSKLQKELRSGKSPAASVWHTLLLMVAGICLLTPGFVTDSLGGLLLIPPFRMWMLRVLIRRWLQKRFSRKVTVVEGEFKVLD